MVKPALKFTAILMLSVNTAFAAEDSSAGLPQLDFTTWPTQIFWLAISFALAYLLMWRIVTPRIGAVLEERRTRLDDDMRRAKQAAAEAESMRLDFEKTLAEARAEAQEKTRSSLEASAALAETKNAEATQRLAHTVAQAEARLSKAQKAALAELDAVAASSAVDVVLNLSGVKITRDEANKAVKKAAKNISEQNDG